MLPPGHARCRVRRGYLVHPNCSLSLSLGVGAALLAGAHDHVHESAQDQNRPAVSDRRARAPPEPQAGMPCQTRPKAGARGTGTVSQKRNLASTQTGKTLDAVRKSDCLVHHSHRAVAGRKSVSQRNATTTATPRHTARKRACGRIADACTRGHAASSSCPASQPARARGVTALPQGATPTLVSQSPSRLSNRTLGVWPLTFPARAREP
jgi:hypothetical protein